MRWTSEFCRRLGSFLVSSEIKGPKVVVLFGSRVRGDAYKESDIDIHAIGRGSRYKLERFQGFLFSVSWETARNHHAAFRSPGKVGGIIPAWRGAKII